MHDIESSLRDGHLFARHVEDPADRTGKRPISDMHVPE